MCEEGENGTSLRREGKIGYGNEERRELSLSPLGSVPRVLWGSLMGMTSEVRCFTSAR